MKPARPLPPPPYVLLLAMSIVSFGGPFLMVGVLWGGESSRWPPDRPIEWVVIGVVLALLLTLFAACLSIRSWYRPGGSKKVGQAFEPDTAKASGSKA